MTRKRKERKPVRIAWHGYVARSLKSGAFFRWLKYYDGSIGCYEDNLDLIDSWRLEYHLPSLFGEPKPKPKPFDVFDGHNHKDVEFVPITIIIGEHSGVVKTEKQNGGENDQK